MVILGLEVGPAYFQFSFRRDHHAVRIYVYIRPVFFKDAVPLRTHLDQMPQFRVDEHATVLRPFFDVLVEIKVVVLPISCDGVGAKGVAAGVAFDFEAVHAEEGVGLDLFDLGEEVEDFGIGDDGVVFEDVAEGHFFGGVDSGGSEVAIFHFDVEL